MKDLVGEVFGKLKVIKKASKIVEHSLWECICSCGGFRIVRGINLSNGTVKGCFVCQPDKYATQRKKSEVSLRNEVILTKKEVCKNDGEVKVTPEYYVWRAMIERCHRKGHAAYRFYGARGVIVCDKWRKSFKAFLEYMGQRPSSSHSLERLKGDLGYQPGNVIWATIEIQARNRRKFTNNTSGKTGVFFEKRRKTWVASIIDLQGKKYQKGFSIKKFGMIPAYAMACILRDELVAELNKQGAGYSIYHGL